ncbi:unnamed protein product [Soboliphyme baturini]|uniref:Uncharacterized protein n=1 Tax=Soboliphyme baturini TaxID=241478 RepID=A0A183IRD1_9BILA|nr:unnamed protein product [Soboliphyme baturini]
MSDDKTIQFTSHNERQIERTRILTMKYGKQQMALIRKRLLVEMWLLEQLEIIFEDEVRFFESMICPCLLSRTQLQEMRNSW